MKKIMFLILTGLSLVASSCMEEDEKFATKTASPGTITFVVPEADPTDVTKNNAVPVPPAGQTQSVVQPSFDIIGGRYRKSLDIVQVTVKLSEGLSDLTINLLSNDGSRQQRGTFSGVSGSVDWSAPLSTLNKDNKAVTSSATLEFVATGSVGTVTRIFTVTVY